MHGVRGMPGREHAGVLTGDVLTPSVFSTTYFHMYSHRWSLQEPGRVERPHGLSPSDRMFSHETSCLSTDTRRARSYDAKPAACGLFSTVQTLLPLSGMELAENIALGY